MSNQQMKTEKELDQAIVNISMKIHEEFPELSKYIDEIPIVNSGEDENVKNIGNLKEYYSSLKEMYETYSKTRGILQNK